jgi:hypothetical protein
MDDRTVTAPPTTTSRTTTSGTATSSTATTSSAAVTPVPPASTFGPRTPDEIEREIEFTRQRLAGTIDELGYRVKPATIAKRGKERARGVVIDETGAPRVNRIATIAGGIAAVVALVAWRKSR